MRKLIGIIVVLVLVLTIMPWVLGLWFEHNYHNLVSLYNSQGDMQVTVEKYQRGWWHSSARLHVKLINPKVRQFFIDSDIDNPQLELIVDESIDHGPIFYNRKSASHAFFGVAYVRNRVAIPQDIQSVLSPDQPLQVSDDDVFTFTGSYHTHFTMSGFHLDFIKNEIYAECNQGIEANIQVNYRQKTFGGEFNIPDFKVSSDDGAISFSQAKIQFDQYQAKSGLWMGNVSSTFPEITMQDSNGDQSRIIGLEFNGTANESAGVVSGLRSVKIDKIYYSDQWVGPFSVKVSASKLDAKAIVNLIEEYRKIMYRGELYQSQLQLKMTSMLPSIFIKNSEIKIDRFNYASSDGAIEMNGYAKWPNNEENVQDISEFLQDSNAQLKLRISITLAKKLIDFAGTLPYFRSITPERRHVLLNLQDDIEKANQRNFLFLSMLVDRQILSEDMALNLLAMQRNGATLDQYREAIKKLFLSKQISLGASYMLFWQYADVDSRNQKFDKAMDQTNNMLHRELRTQFEDWIKQGYIKQDKNDYIVQINKEGSDIKMNGKVVYDSDAL